MKCPKNWKLLERHPLSAEYPDWGSGLRDEVLAQLKADGKPMGNRKITLHEGMILDGWQLHGCCAQLNIKPDFQLFPAKRDPIQFVRAMNDLRRHETTEIISKRAAERRERVAAARQNGESIRIIAEREKVSPATIHNDLASSTVQVGEQLNLPENIVGKDGKSRPATNPKPLCDRCQRVGKTAKCEACKALRKPSKPEPAGTSDADESVMTDLEGKPVPDQSRPAFARADIFVGIGKEIDALINRAKELSEQPGGRLIQFEDVKVHFKNAKGGIVGARPTHVCPLCDGKRPNCQCCKGEGWTVEHVWKRLTAEKVK